MITTERYRSFNKIPTQKILWNCVIVYSRLSAISANLFSLSEICVYECALWNFFAFLISKLSNSAVFYKRFLYSDPRDALREGMKIWFHASDIRNVKYSFPTRYVSFRLHYTRTVRRITALHSGYHNKHCENDKVLNIKAFLV